MRIGSLCDRLPVTVEDAAASLRSGELSSVDLVSATIARADALDPTLGAM